MLCSSSVSLLQMIFPTPACGFQSLPLCSAIGSEGVVSVLALVIYLFMPMMTIWVFLDPLLHFCGLLATHFFLSCTVEYFQSHCSETLYFLNI